MFVLRALHPAGIQAQQSLIWDQEFPNLWPSSPGISPAQSLGPPLSQDQGFGHKNLNLENTLWGTAPN